MISFNFGGGRARRGGGGLLPRLRKTAATSLPALTGADYSRSARPGPGSGAGGPRAGGGDGGFDRFRASRPDLFDPADGEDDLTDDETPDGDLDEAPPGPTPGRASRTWDGSPETDADRRFFDLRQSGYRGPIDAYGHAVGGDGTHRTRGGR